MSNEAIVLLIVVAKRKLKEKIVTALHDVSATLFNVTYAKGSVQQSNLLESLGLTVEQGKVMITCLISLKQSDEALQMLVKRFDFNKPNTGIAFTIPVESLGY